MKLKENELQRNTTGFSIKITTEKLDHGENITETLTFVHYCHWNNTNNTLTTLSKHYVLKTPHTTNHDNIHSLETLHSLETK